MSGVGGASAGVESSPLETELRDLITKMQSSFTQIIHSQAAIVRANRGTWARKGGHRTGCHSGTATVAQ